MPTYQASCRLYSIVQIFHELSAPMQGDFGEAALFELFLLLEETLIKLAGTLS